MAQKRNFEVDSYPEPLETLFTYDTPQNLKMENWPDYLAPGITTEHIPALLRMIADPGLRTNDPEEDDPKYWAGVHAWRALGQLRDVSAVEPLLQQAEDLFDDTTGFGDWAIEELPDVYSAVGPAAIPILTKCIADPSWTVDTRVNAMTGLTKIATGYPEHREEIVTFFTSQLEQFTQNDPEINGYLISNLAHLKAVETLPLIEEVFASENVDTFLIGLKDVEVEFGLRERPEPMDLNTFLQNLSQLQDQGDTLPANQTFPPPYVRQNVPHTPSSSPPRGGKNKVTKKAKAKMEKKSRKQNRGK